MSNPVDIKCRGPIDTASYSAHEVVLDPFLIHVLSDLTFKLLSVHAQLPRIGKGDIRIAESCLVFVEKVVHRPELSLGGGCFCCLGGVHGMLVDICYWKVALHKSQIRPEFLLYLFHFRI